LTINHTGGQSGTTTTGYFPFVFIAQDGTLDPVPVPITAPGRAGGSVTREHANDYVTTLTFDFECVTCRPAVG